MSVISLLYYFLKEMKKKLTSFQFLIGRIQKKMISSALEVKLIQKLGKKGLEVKLEELDSSLRTHCKLSVYSKLSPHYWLRMQKAHGEAQMCA